MNNIWFGRKREAWWRGGGRHPFIKRLARNSDFIWTWEKLQSKNNDLEMNRNTILYILFIGPCLFQLQITHLQQTFNTSLISPLVCITIYHHTRHLRGGEGETKQWVMCDLHPYLPLTRQNTYARTEIHDSGEEMQADCHVERVFLMLLFSMHMTILPPIPHSPERRCFTDGQQWTKADQ